MTQVFRQFAPWLLVGLTMGFLKWLIWYGGILTGIAQQQAGRRELPGPGTSDGLPGFDSDRFQQLTEQVEDEGFVILEDQRTPYYGPIEQLVIEPSPTKPKPTSLAQLASSELKPESFGRAMVHKESGCLAKIHL